MSFLYLLINNFSVLVEFKLFTLNSASVEMILLFDWMSVLFISFVVFISSLVIYYSLGYLEGDYNKPRFVMLVMMFVLSMVLMIISPNLISILLGWDGLGLVSYCLVVYYQNIKSFNAGMLTALSNRVGDVALLMAIAWMLNYGSWNFMFYLECMKTDKWMMIISWFVLFGAFTKSAQIPFSSWLPAAMAAPTPVSALVHSSTLVTAGVYLLIRFNFSFTSEMMGFILLISSVTMLMSGLSANLEFDLKKIIAFSTLSQLGLMMSTMALGSYKLAFIHLLIHALFKALLFLCAGMIIHNLNNCQDIRFMGGVMNYLPLTSSMLVLSNLSLCGLPFLSGFYSKDLIVEMMSMNELNLAIYVIYYFSIGLTVSYSFRLIYYLLVGNMNLMSVVSLDEGDSYMYMSMSCLSLMSIISGSSIIWVLDLFPYYICLSFLMKMLTVLIIIIGGGFGCLMAVQDLSFQFNKSLQKYFMNSMWNLTILSTLGVSKYNLVMGKVYLKIDFNWFEYYGSKSVFMAIINLANFIQLFSKNHFKLILMLIFIWLIFMFFLNSLN
uniref:NADH-ubiquinone oxidoreductase chain 5 n=1 Tax=Aspidiphorus orbiculatus TaxID=577441 RepID=A0A0S2M6G3_9CUCU|nr:NADH deshydrogenase subunit 5 [Aspidiphorus orbiculatus]